MFEIDGDRYVPTGHPAWRIEKIRRDCWVAYKLNCPEKTAQFRTLRDALSAFKV